LILLAISIRPLPLLGRGRGTKIEAKQGASCGSASKCRGAEVAGPIWSVGL
jgi:hypothetical protein